MAGINGFPGFITNFPRGTTKDFYVGITRNGVPVDITGCKFYLTFSDCLDPTKVPIIQITIDPPTAPLDGETMGTITDDQTFSLAAQTYYYTLQFINAVGASFVIDMGRIKVYETVSDKLE